MTREPFRADEPRPRDTRSYSAVGGDRHGDIAGRTNGGAVSRLRPYLLTSGRAEPVDDTLEIEAQVLTTELGVRASGRLSFEYREIVELCRGTLSVAEVAAQLKLHIGVARVLVADLAAQGYLIVERPGFQFAQDKKLIEMVIRGLEAIR
jgi:Protein of unknown function (DUF742)